MIAIFTFRYYAKSFPLLRMLAPVVSTSVYDINAIVLILPSDIPRTSSCFDIVFQQLLRFFVVRFHLESNV